VRDNFTFLCLLYTQLESFLERDYEKSGPGLDLGHFPSDFFNHFFSVIYLFSGLPRTADMPWLPQNS
jgi:hypothetical protein